MTEIILGIIAAGVAALAGLRAAEVALVWRALGRRSEETPEAAEAGREEAEAAGSEALLVGFDNLMRYTAGAAQAAEELTWEGRETL